MPHDIALSGVRGEVRYGYHLAAQVGSWDVDQKVLTAKLTIVVNALPDNPYTAPYEDLRLKPR